MDRLLEEASARALLTLFVLIAGTLTIGCSSSVVGDEQVPLDRGGGGGGGSSGDGGRGDGGTPCTINDEMDCGGGINRAWCIDMGGTPGWTKCCDPSTAPICSGDGCYGNSAAAKCFDGIWQCQCQPTPLVLSFDRTPVEFAVTAASFAFDLTGGKASIATDWPTARTPWLALDRDDDGRINDGGELFGSATRLAGGDLAVNGFSALRELDSNGDGRITEADEAWPRLLLWSDRDGDRVSTAGELASISSRRLSSIDLGYTVQTRCNSRGNCEVERATFRYVDEAGDTRTGDIVDVHLAAQ